MELSPINIDVSIEQLFGEDYQNILYDYEIESIQSAIEDGVIDSNDLSSENSSKICYEYSGRNKRFSRDKDKFLFSCNDEIIRRIHFQLSKYARIASDGLFIESDEAANFRKFITNKVYEDKTGLEIIRDGSTSLMIGADLYCKGDYYEKCEPIIVDSSELLLVTHALSSYDEESAKVGIDRLTTRFQREGIPFFYLVVEHRPFTGIYSANKNPNKYIHSNGGFNSVDFRGETLVLAGGYFERCYLTSLSCILQNRSVDKDLEVKIYTNSVFDLDENLSDLFEKMGVNKTVNYIKESLYSKLAGIEKHYQSADRYEERYYYNISFTYKGEKYWVNKTSSDSPTVNIDII